MGYWSGSAWKSYLDNLGRFYLNAGVSTNYLAWNGSTLSIDGTIVVRGGSGIANLSDAGALATADNLDGVPNGTTYARVSSTIIAGGLIQVGSGTKDTTLDGWHISATEIVGQLNGADQVVFTTAGAITAGSGAVTLNANGITLSLPTTSWTIASSLEWHGLYGAATRIASYFTGAQEYILLLQSFGNNTVRSSRVRIEATAYNSVGAAFIDISNDYYGNPLIVQALYVPALGTIYTLSASLTYTQIATRYGYVNIGPTNANYCHFTTDRPTFYFDKGVSIGANLITSYNADFALQRAGTTRLTLTSTGASVTGSLDVSSALTVTGTVGGSWTALTPAGNWSNAGSPNATLGYKAFGTMVSVKGRVAALAAISAAAAISNTALPVPSATRSFACMSSRSSAKDTVRVYVGTDGIIRAADGFASGDWLDVEFTYFTGG